MNDSDLLELIKLSISGDTVDFRATISPKKLAVSPTDSMGDEVASSETIDDIAEADAGERAEALPKSRPVQQFELLGEIGRVFPKLDSSRGARDRAAA